MPRFVAAVRAPGRLDRVHPQATPVEPVADDLGSLRGQQRKRRKVLVLVEKPLREAQFSGANGVKAHEPERDRREEPPS